MSNLKCYICLGGYANCIKSSKQPFKSLDELSDMWGMLGQAAAVSCRLYFFLFSRFCFLFTVHFTQLMQATQNKIKQQIVLLSRVAFQS